MVVTETWILDDCAKKHAEVRDMLSAWQGDIERAAWRTPQDIYGSYTNVKMVTGKCARFGLKGARYRVLCRINYQQGIVQVVFAGTHDQYNQVNARALCEGK